MVGFLATRYPEMVPELKAYLVIMVKYARDLKGQLGLNMIGLFAKEWPGPKSDGSPRFEFCGKGQKEHVM